MNDKYNYVDKAREYLLEIANKDGIVTDEEQKLIDKILLEVQNYENVFKEAIEDQKLDSGERLKLFKAKLNILRNAARAVHEDLHVSQDEEEILKGLRSIFPDMQESEKGIERI